jgi:hypothetical protein
MKCQDLAVLQAAGCVLIEGATKEQILNSVANTIDAIGPSKFKTLRDVEGKSLEVLRAALVEGTVLEPLAVALSVSSGQAPCETAGELMDRMRLTQPDVNALACHCANGDEMTANRAAQNLRNIASGRSSDYSFYGYSG